MKTEQEIKDKIAELYLNKDIINMNLEQKPAFIMLDMLEWVLNS